MLEEFAGFVVVFGVWDIFYYVFLRVLVTWPASLLDWDILFLIPLPWVGPVLAPVLIAGMDALALVHQEAALSHEDARVRASAMAGLQGSMLFGVSGPEAVSEAGTRRGGVDREMAERVRGLVC